MPANQDLLTTVDALLDGKLLLEQPAHGRGYRFNEDSVHLAEFASRNRPFISLLVDLGAGIGTVALCMTRMTKVHRLTLIEQDAAMCSLAARNLERCGLGPLASILNIDVGNCRRNELDQSPDVIVANPPYGRPGNGRSPNPDVESARRGDLRPFLDAAAALLSGSESGSAFFCYPAGALVNLLECAEQRALIACRMRFVHGRADRPASIVLLELKRPPAPELIIEPPHIASLSPERAKHISPG